MHLRTPQVEWRGNRLAIFSPKGSVSSRTGSHSPAPFAKPPVVNTVLSDCASAWANSGAWPPSPYPSVLGGEDHSTPSFSSRRYSCPRPCKLEKEWKSCN